MSSLVVVFINSNTEDFHDVLWLHDVTFVISDGELFFINGFIKEHVFSFTGID